MDKKDLKTLLLVLLREHPEIFPTEHQMHLLLRLYGIKGNARGVFSEEEKSNMKLEWIKTYPDDKRFLECFRKPPVLSNLNLAEKRAVHKRLVRILKKLCSNDKSFPVAARFSEAMKRTYGFGIGPNTVEDHINLMRKQIKWIEKATDEVFINTYLENIFSSVRPEVKEATQKRFKKLIKRAIPRGVFPSFGIMSDYFTEKYGIFIHKTVFWKNSAANSIQESWVKKVKPEVLLKNMKSSGIVHAKQHIYKILLERFYKICEELCKKKKVFPTYCALSDLLFDEYHLKFHANSISFKIDLSKMQISWVKNIDNLNFLKLLKKGCNPVSKEAIQEIKTKFHNILMKLFKDPNQFPSHRKISAFINEKCGIELDMYTIRILDVSPFQIRWVQNAEVMRFLSMIKEGTYNSTRGKVREAIASKLHDIAMGVCKDLCVFPGYETISASINGKYKISLHKNTIRTLNGVSIQVDWVRNCKEEVFFKNMKIILGNPATNPKVRAEVVARKAHILAEQKAMAADHDAFVKHRGSKSRLATSKARMRQAAMQVSVNKKSR